MSIIKNQSITRILSILMPYYYLFQHILHNVNICLHEYIITYKY